MTALRTKFDVLADLQQYPERHIHIDLAGLTSCCTIDCVDGQRSIRAVDAELVEAHSHYVDMGSNGGRRCDVVSGPCSCGAWHNQLPIRGYAHRSVPHHAGINRAAGGIPPVGRCRGQVICDGGFLTRPGAETGGWLSF